MERKVKVTGKHLKESINEGIMTFKCPKCKHSVMAEPDAETTCCQTCNTMITIINPYF